jgi:Domain of unknown function (DUF4416)
MGSASDFPREKLIIPVLFSDESSLKSAVGSLVRRYGATDYRSPELPFTYSGYYNREMGTEIRRVFLGFEELVDPSRLWRVKRYTNSLERRFTAAGGRRVNLDPGLLDLNRLLLATTKHAGHRIPLRQGIYAEITLHYRRGRFEPLPWTYPDYRSREYQEILLELREILHRQLKRQEPSALL